MSQPWERNTMRRKKRHYAVSVPIAIYERVRLAASDRGWSMTEMMDEIIEATVPDWMTVEVGRRINRSAIPSAPPICSTCNDTHTMTLGDREVMCTRCPVPCDRCQQGTPPTAPYCATTPCPCSCHTQPATPGGSQ